MVQHCKWRKRGREKAINKLTNLLKCPFPNIIFIFSKKCGIRWECKRKIRINVKSGYGNFMHKTDRGLPVWCASISSAKQCVEHWLEAILETKINKMGNFSF